MDVVEVEWRDEERKTSEAFTYAAIHGAQGPLQTTKEAGTGIRASGLGNFQLEACDNSIREPYDASGP